MQIVESKFVANNVAIGIGSIFFFSIIAKKISKYLSRKSSKYTNLTDKIKEEWHFRNISTLHAIIVCLLICYVIVVDWNELRDPLWGTSWKAEGILAISLGYIASDIIYMLLFSSPRTTDAFWTTILHHVLVLVAYSTVVARGVMVYVALIRFLAEVSTPFVNFRWMLHVCDMKSSRWYMYNGWIMLISFFLCRIVAMPYCYYVILTANDPAGLESLKFFVILYITFAAIVDGLNIYWFIRMVKGALKYYKKQN